MEWSQQTNYERKRECDAKRAERGMDLWPLWLERETVLGEKYSPTWGHAGPLERQWSNQVKNYY